MSSPYPPEEYRITPQEFWQMYKNLELKEYVSADHLIMAIKKADDEPVWCIYRN